MTMPNAQFQRFGYNEHMKQHIVVLGMGDMGTALASLLRKNKHGVDCWDKSSGKVRGQKSLFEIIPRADILFLCVPSWSLPNVIKTIHPFVHKKTVIVGVSKGLQDNKETTYELLSHSFFEGQPVAIFGGAMLANELLKGAPGVGVVASKSAGLRERIAELFHGTNLKVSTSSDVRGVALCGVLKNVYALGLGITKGIGWGENARAWYAFESINEMDRIVKLLGGKSESVYGAAGVIDFIATGFSEYSKNVEAGILVVKKKKCVSGSESASSFEPLLKLIKSDIHSFPLLRATHRAATCKEDAAHVFHKLFK